jgi:hypothetical protein
MLTIHQLQIAFNGEHENCVDCFYICITFVHEYRSVTIYMNIEQRLLAIILGYNIKT